MTADFSVHQRGVDPYGRAILMTNFMWEWWLGYCDELGFTPRILQGAWMERIGGGAAASSGAHDKGKCLDLETEGRTLVEIDRMVRIARDNGAGAYRRDRTWRHGSMTPHMHLTLGADEPGSPMANILWSSYVNGGDGLDTDPQMPDYEVRPDPLVLVPPEGDDMPSPKDWTAEDYAALMEKLGKPLVKAIWDASVTKAGTAVVAARKALRISAGLGD